MLAISWERLIRLLRLPMLLVAALLFSGVLSSCYAVTLAWDAIDIEPSGYTLHWGISSGVYVHSLDIPGDVTQAEVIGLAIGETYYFAVTAYIDCIDDDSGGDDPCGVGEVFRSGYSNEVIYTYAINEPPAIATSGSLRWVEIPIQIVPFDVRWNKGSIELHKKEN